MSLAAKDVKKAFKELESSLLRPGDDGETSTTCGESEPGEVLTEEESQSDDDTPPLPPDWIHPQEQWYEGIASRSRKKRPEQDACSAVNTLPFDPAGDHRMKLNKRSWFPFNACVARSVNAAELRNNEKAGDAM